LTLRNRELVNLLLVGLLTAAGFTAVYIARQDVVSAGSLSYAAFFLAVFVAAHVILRFALPNADPFLLPLGGLLTAVGLTMIYRIDPDLALRQGLWVVVGLAAFALLVVFLRDYRLLDRYKYILGLTAIFLLALPAVVSLISGSASAGRLPAGRVRRSCWSSSSRATCATTARCSDEPTGMPSTLRPAARHLGRGDARSFERTSAATLLRSSSPCSVTARWQYVVVGSASSPRAHTPLPRHAARARARLDLVGLQLDVLERLSGL
jgi:hypothetical protein